MTETHAGRCTCGAITYRLTDRPLFVHCCHCTWCQRETGAAFALNALIEADRMQVAGEVQETLTPSASGKGQRIFRCAACRVALWSVYAGTGPLIRFVRAGTLDAPDRCPPDIHIFTSTRLPWLPLPDGVPAMPGYYRRSVHWPDWARARRSAALEG